MIQKAKKKLTGKTKTGAALNPLGGWLEDPVLRAFRQLSKEELANVGNMILHTNEETLRYWIKKKDCNVLRLMVARVALRIIDNGDMDMLDKLLNRLIGKVKDEVDLSANMNHAQVIVTLPPNGKEADINIEDLL